ncbi:MAG: exonuclease domain-containing protein [Patescibacteria group bacterium]
MGKKEVINTKEILPRKLVIVDIETTGLHSGHDRIIELAILKVENNKLIDSFTTLVNPQTYLSPFIERFTGITSRELQSAPLFADINEKVWEFLEGSVFVAHNARFDYGFIKTEFRRTGITWSAKTLCTVKLSRRLFPEHRHHGLEALIERYKFKYKARHRAYDDAHIVWQFLKKLPKEVPKPDLTATIGTLLKSSYSGTAHLRAQIESLPESSGVYIFYDNKNKPLYIGKSTVIKERVISHFSRDYETHKSLQLIRHTDRIDYIKTAGELSALIEESRMIKLLKPIYNKKLVEKKQVYVARKMVNPQGFHTLLLELMENLDNINLDEVFGLYKNKRSAKEAMQEMTKTYGLCEKLMGLEKTNSSCFAYKLGRCKGACCGAESKKMYNGRFIIAYAKHQEFAPWPFRSAVAITEKDEEHELYQTYVVDNWRIVRQIQGEESIDYENHFDVDIYKILVSYLKHKKINLKLVK